MGERLLCKQEVVGSIPSASMVRRLRLHGPPAWRVCGGVAGLAVLSWKDWLRMMRALVTAVGRGGAFVVCGRVCGRAVCGCVCGCAGLVVFIDCESGSGASLDARDVSGDLGCAAVWRCGSWVVAGGP